MTHVAIIGAGLGSIAAALYLRRAGVDVTIFEKNAEIGGKLATLVHDGYTFDLGPTVLTMPFVLRDLFDAAGSRLDDLVDLCPVEPTCRYHWSDGTRFDAFADPKRRESALRASFPDDRAAVEQLLRDAGRLYEATKEVFLFRPFRGLRELVSTANLRLLPQLASLGFTTTLDASLRGRLRSEKLIQLFDRFATYNGSSPYHAPATLNIISHVELGLGAWYPRGGMGRIAAALEGLCSRQGIEVVRSAKVHRLIRIGNRVAGLAVDGYERGFDAVISNVDALWSYRNLLAPVGIPVPRSLARAERSSSGFLMLAAVSGNHPDLSHHNIFFSDDYREEFRDIFDRRRLPEAMTIYLSIASKSDPSLAPAGKENWYLLVNAPAGGIDHDAPERHERYAEQVLARLAQFGLKPDIEWHRTMPPVWIEGRYNSLDGAIYGTSSNSIFSAFLRPAGRVPGLSNMYLAGGSAHPGGGIPLAILSGKLAAERLLADMRS